MVVGNKTAISIGGRDVWIVKLDGTGMIEWNRTFGGTGDEQVQSAPIKSFPNGDFIFATSTNSPADGNITEARLGDTDYWVVRMDSLGQVIWDKRVGGSANEVVSDMAIRQDGTIIVTGYSTSGISGNKTDINYGSWDIWTVALDPDDGDLLWDLTIGSNDADIPYAVTNTSDEELIIIGESRSGTNPFKSEPQYGSSDYWAIKLVCTVELDTLPNDISPLSQTACFIGQPMTILGSDDDDLSQDRNQNDSSS